MWFRHRQRVDAAFAKGLMFGKAVGARDERERIIALLTNTDDHLIVFDTSIKKKDNRLIHSAKCGLCKSIAVIKGGEDD